MALTLIVKPVTGQSLSLSVSSYLGGPQFDHIRDVSFDSAGNMYVTGGTEAPDLQYTNSLQKVGLVETSSVTRMDVFVAKFDPSGRRQWITVIGGPNYDRAYAVEVDAKGYIYVAGRAGSGFPVTNGAFQKAFMGGSEAPFYGGQDGFVLKLTPDGSNIVWATYFGATDASMVRDLDVDAQGNVYIVSQHTSGASYPASVQAVFNRGPFPQPKGKDAVVAKIAANGSQLLWAMHLGGSGAEVGENSIRLDAAGNPVVLTVTNSTNMPTTAGAFSRTRKGGYDFYVAKVRSDGAGLIFGTYLGGSGSETVETHNLALDKSGNIFVGAGTLSTNFPMKGAYDATFNGVGGSGTGKGTNYAGDGVIAKLSPDGRQLLASTYLGGRYGDQVEGIQLDGAGNVYVSGGTYSDNFPVSANAYQRTRRGPSDGFVAKLSNSLKSLVYGSFIGGSQLDSFRGLALDASGNAVAGGQTESLDFPLRGAFQSNYIGATDGAFVKFTIR